MKKALTVVLVAASLAFAQTVLAASMAKGHAHFILLKAKDVPLKFATISGVCKSDDGSFFGGESVQNKWSCTTGANGACAVELDVFVKSDGKISKCKATMASMIAEQGGSAEKSSFLTFFANGGEDSYNFLQKISSWKHGGYYFSSFKSREDFDAVALKHNPGFYKSKILIKEDQHDAPVTLSTSAAHIAEDKNYPSTQFIVASVERKSFKPSVQIQVTDTYIDYSFRSLTAAKYATPAGPKTVEVTKISQSANCTVRDLLERKCTYQETVGFGMDMGTARQLAALYKPEENGMWKFSVSSKSGKDLQMALSHAEFAALIEKVDEYIGAHKK